MANEMSGEQMQAKIAAARRDAEGLKDRIKRKKDELADTNRKFLSLSTALPSRESGGFGIESIFSILSISQIWLS